MTSLPDPDLLKKIEAMATKIAWEAGQVLRQHFGSNLHVEYKGEGDRDPVTAADKASQALLKNSIAEAFPDHGIVSEEEPDREETPAPDLVWVLDPLDGTTNFLNGLPIYAVSIGVLHRGEPLVGALFIPWPDTDAGVVAHAHKGGGAYFGETMVHAYQGAEPQGKLLAAVPGHFDSAYRLKGQIRADSGDPRVTGSIVYEMNLVSQGALQYAIHFSPSLWDVAGGVVVVREAGGTVLMRQRGHRGWGTLDSFFPLWDQARPTLKQMGQWSASIISAGSHVALPLATGLRHRPMLGHKLARIVQRLKTKRKKPADQNQGQGTLW